MSAQASASGSRDATAHAASGVSLCFVIPVRHPDNAKDWSRLCRNLAETAAAIARQSSPDWRAIVVANRGASLPDLPPGFSVQRVDFPPNPRYAGSAEDREQVLEAIRFDKGRRVLAGVLAAPDARHIMVVDDDDFISSRIAAFISRQPGTCCWQVNEGYFWDEGSRLMFRHWDFSSLCGTSLVVPRAAYTLPQSVEAADPALIRAEFGSHIQIKPLLRDKGFEWKPLPFPGAIYRVGHAESHSQSRTMFRRWFMDRRLITRPGRLLRHIRRLTPVTTALAAEFGLP